jgi:cytochrome c5
MTGARTMLGFTFALGIALVVLATSRSAPAAQTPAPIILPAQNTTFRPGPGVELAQRDCLTCHSAEYVTSQPPLSKAGWTKEITKMRVAYGAPIPDGDTAALVAYLVAQNPASQK